MSQARPKIVFFGTPELAVPPLRALVDSGSYEVLAAVTQPDKPAGRGNQLSASPVKEFALNAGIPVFQPASLKKAGVSAELLEFLNQNAPIDIFVVVAYGKIIPLSLIELPRRGIVNIHMSLLPRWRGAAPIQRAVLSGDTVAGVSIMKIDEGLDTGPVYASAKVDIGPDDDSGTLTENLIRAGVPLLLETLPAILDGTLSAVPQPEEGATYAEKLDKPDFQINWNKRAAELRNLIRAASPHPGATTAYENGTVKIFQAHEVKNAGYADTEPGTIVESTKVSLVAAAGEKTFLALDVLQLPGKKRMPVADLLRGKGIPKGAKLS